MSFVFNPDLRCDGVGPTNGERVAWAGGALAHYVSLLRGEDTEPTETKVQDLISDLFHLCDSKGIDVPELVRIATDRWQEEREPEVIDCALCGKRIYYFDSYSPGDDAICAECDTEVTGRKHDPSLKPPGGAQ